MQIKILILYLVLLTGISISQKMPEDYLDEGNEKFDAEDFEGAKLDYKYIIDNFTTSEVYPFAMYNYGKCLQNTKQENEAIVIYEGIIKSSFNDKLLKATGSIMENPYANFSFYSCMSLGEIYKSKQEYDKALKYYFLADTADLFVTFCGNLSYEVKSDLLDNISLCLFKLNRYKKVIKALTPYLLSEYFDENSEAGKYYIKSLSKIYSENEIVDILQETSRNLYKRNDKYYIYLFTNELTIFKRYSIYQYEFTSKDEARITLMNNFLFKHYLN